MTEAPHLPPSPPASDLGHPLPGWYRHPTDPKLEQWWTGVGWAEQTRPAPSLATVPAVNRAARNGRTLGFVASGLILLMIAVVIVTGFLHLLSGFLVLALLLLSPITFVVGVTATVASGVGLSRARERSGRGASITGLILGLIAVVVAVALLAFIVVAFYVASPVHA